MSPRRREPAALLLVGTVLLALSGLSPRDRFTWMLEIAPILIVVPILIVTYAPAPLTPLAYRLILAHACVLMVGGHYTYAEVPLGEWMRSAFGFARNDYDRIGHFAQGFVPAVVAREVLLRRTPLVRGAWLFFLVTCVCLAFSALYELVEWWTSVATSGGATAFLATQGDPWDTQWDMLWALVGAITAQLTLAQVQDGQMRVEAAGNG